MADRPAKRARLIDLRSRLPYCSQSALSALLRIAASEELPDSSSRAFIRSARDSASTVATPYGPVHQELALETTTGGELKLELQAPFASFWWACNISSQLSALLKRNHDATPSTIEKPWRLLLYCDEVLPGNQLAYKSERKFWAFYWSLLELGPAALADEVRKYM